MILQPKRMVDIGPAELASLLERSAQDIASVYDRVRSIVEDVKGRGDNALLEANREFKEGVTVSDLKVTEQELERAYEEVGPGVLDSLKVAARNISRFHQAQVEREMWLLEVSEGILAGRMIRPVDRVGCYVPGGRAAYPSSVLMTVIPALVAGVKEVAIATPPGKGMVVNPATLVAADISGCREIYKTGGPWGIAALAFGTKTVSRVDKIVGPGNKYVTAAKMMVYGKVDIDSPAGPSEALILADDTADPSLVAMDFLSQVEHDPDSAAVLVTPSEDLAERVCLEIDREFDALPRKEILRSSLANSRVILVPDMDSAVDFSNRYAPEHLQIMTREPFSILPRIRHAGSVFLGSFAPVPVGDYASGTNHVLPTAQAARMFSGLSVDDFIKKPTFQYLSKKGLESIKDAVVTLAEAEGLPMHARSILARFDKA